MKTILSLATLVLLAFSTLSAQADLHFLVSAEPHLNLRAEPSQNAAVLKMVPDQALVQDVQDDNYDLDTVMGLTGSWELVRYEEVEGWAFNAFLAAVSLPDTAPDWVVLDAHAPEFWGLVPFHEDLNWYTMHYNADSTTTYFRPFTHRFTCEFMGWEEPGLNIEWDEGPMPELLIATTEELAYEPNAELLNSRGMAIGFLAPYEEAGIGLESGLMIHMAGWIGEAGEETWSNQPYELRYKIGAIGHGNQSLFALKDSGKSLMGGEQSALYASIYQKPAVIWAGDLNKDGIPDVITRNAAGYDSCGYFEETALHLGKKSEDGYQLVKETGWR